MKYLYLYLCIVNALAFVFMLIDKRNAIKNRRRIPERTLLTLCAIGGSLGGYMSMQLFRHKTKHHRFSLGIPLMLALHIMILLFIHAKY